MYFVLSTAKLIIPGGYRNSILQCNEQYSKTKTKIGLNSFKK